MKKTIKKSFAVLLTLLTVVFIMPISSHAVTTDIPSDAVEYNGHYYYAFDEGKTWTEAKEKCEVIGGHLVTITTQEEQEIVESIIKNGTKSCYWLGGTDEIAEGQWKWITGEEFKYTHWAKDMPDNFLTENYLMMFKEPHPRRAGNTFGLWNDLKEDCTCKGTPFFRKDGFGFICEWGVSNSESHFPSEYDPQKDSWSFSNQTLPIPISVYKTVLGKVKGAISYKAEKLLYGTPGEGGSCYGMAASTGAFFKEYLDITSVLIDPVENPDWYAGCMANCYNGSYNLNDSYITPISMNLSEFIMYGQVLQETKEMSKQEKSNKNDLAGLYSSTVDYINGSGEPIVVCVSGVYKGKSSHALYVRGLGIDDENKTEILVNDSNDPYDTQRKLILKKTNGNYSAWEYDFTDDTRWGTGQSNAKLSYVFPSYDLYCVTSKNTKTATTAYSGLMSNESNLVFIGGNVNGLNVDENKIYPVNFSAGLEEEKDNYSVLWVEDGVNDINFDSGKEDSEITFANNKVAVTVDTQKNAVTDLALDEEKYTASITAKKNEEITLSVYTLASDSDEYEYYISGKVNEKTVVVERKENNIVVNGLNNVEITLKKDGESTKVPASIQDGRQIKIVIDEDKNTVDVDYAKKTIENACGYCGKVHGTSFAEVLIKFFHKIFCFFAKLFGTRK